MSKMNECGVKKASQLQSFYRSPYIVRVIKSRTSRWVGHVAKMEEGRIIFEI